MSMKVLLKKRFNNSKTHPICKRIFKNRVHGMRENEGDDSHSHFAKEKNEQAQRVELQEASVLTEGTYRKESIIVEL